MVKIALYSCNFGDYRNEFNLYYNSVFDKNIDYFLFTDKKFTDNEIIQLKNWNICNIDTLESDEIMDKFRWTSKHVKFILPEKLKDYDVIIWVDNKRVPDLIKLTYEKIINIINKYPTREVFNLKHQERNTAQEELLITMEINVENKESGKYFLNYIDNYISKFKLPDTCIIIRKNNLLTNEAFEHCFNLMKEYKLKRDQNIYNFAFDKKNIRPVLLDYLTLDFLQEEL
jgi:hypothetical protein